MFSTKHTPELFLHYWLTLVCSSTFLPPSKRVNLVSLRVKRPAQINGGSRQHFAKSYAHIIADVNSSLYIYPSPPSFLTIDPSSLAPFLP